MSLVFRPLLPRENDYERYFALLMPLAGIAAAVLFFTKKIPLPPCPVRQITGIPCAGCGSTRATFALAHGDIFHALYFNPLWTLLCVTGVIFYGYCASVIFLGKRRSRLENPTSRELWIFRVCVTGAILSNWLWVLFRELQ